MVEGHRCRHRFILGVTSSMLSYVSRGKRLSKHSLRMMIVGGKSGNQLFLLGKRASCFEPHFFLPAYDWCLILPPGFLQHHGGRINRIAVLGPRPLMALAQMISKIVPSAMRRWEVRSPAFVVGFI